MLSTKCGRIVEALRKMKGLPEKKNKEKYARYNRFEKGLNEFAASTIRRCFVPIKN